MTVLAERGYSGGGNKECGGVGRTNKKGRKSKLKKIKKNGARCKHPRKTGKNVVK